MDVFDRLVEQLARDRAVETVFLPVILAAVWPLATVLCFALDLLKAIRLSAVKKQPLAASWNAQTDSRRSHTWRVFLFGSVGWALFLGSAAVDRQTGVPFLAPVGALLLMYALHLAGTWR